MSPAGSSSARAEWDKKLERNWSAVRFVGMEVRSRDEQHLFRTAIELGALDPDACEWSCTPTLWVDSNRVEFR
jgi:hypothetical protein